MQALSCTVPSCFFPALKHHSPLRVCFLPTYVPASFPLRWGGPGSLDPLFQLSFVSLKITLEGRYNHAMRGMRKLGSMSAEWNQLGNIHLVLCGHLQAARGTWGGRGSPPTPSPLPVPTQPLLEKEPSHKVRRSASPSGLSCPQLVTFFLPLPASSLVHHRAFPLAVGAGDTL